MQKCSNRTGYLNSLQIRVCCLLGLCHGADTQVVTDVSNDRTVLKTIYRKVIMYACVSSANLLNIYIFIIFYLFIY